MTQKSWVKAGPLVFEQSPRRVRAEIGGIAVADSTRVLWLWKEGKVLPLYLFPSDDVRTDLLRPSEHPLPEAHHGLASYSLRSRSTDGWPRTPPGPTRQLRPPRERGSQTTWPSVGERWTPGTRRSRFSRTRATRTRALIPGRALATCGWSWAEKQSSTPMRPRLVFEAGLPTRYYIPPEDIRMDLLTPSETRTLCAYKGEASYWSATVGDEVYEDIASCYPDPLADNPQIRDLVCFLDEQADIEVDGERLGRPTAQWSAGLRSNVRGGGSGSEQGPHATE